MRGSPAWKSRWANGRPPRAERRETPPSLQQGAGENLAVLCQFLSLIRSNPFQDPVRYVPRAVLRSLRERQIKITTRRPLAVLTSFPPSSAASIPRVCLRLASAFPNSRHKNTHRVLAL